MTAVVAFRRRPGEPIDQAIARFQLLTHRAANLGNFVLHPTQLVWMLSNALGIPPGQWAQLLAPAGGTLPVDQPGFDALENFIRRQGHLYEQAGVAQAATQAPRAALNVGNYYTGAEDYGHSSVVDSAVFPMFDRGAGGAGGMTWDWKPDGTGMGDGAECGEIVNCEKCWAAYPRREEDNSTATESDDGEAIPKGVMVSIDERTTGTELYDAYMTIKKQWRRFAGKAPRRYRLRRNNKGRANGFGRRVQKKSGWSFLTNDGGGALCPHCTACIPTAEVYFGKGNPKGRNGLPLKCDCYVAVTTPASGSAGAAPAAS